MPPRESAHRSYAFGEVSPDLEHAHRPNRPGSIAAALLVVALLWVGAGNGVDAVAAPARQAAPGDAQPQVCIAEAVAQRGDTEEALRQLSEVVGARDRQTLLHLQLRRKSLWLLSPHLIEVRSDRRWKTRYA